MTDAHDRLNYGTPDRRIEVRANLEAAGVSMSEDESALVARCLKETGGHLDNAISMASVDGCLAAHGALLTYRAAVRAPALEAAA
jgi:hypothetical protein